MFKQGPDFRLEISGYWDKRGRDNESQIYFIHFGVNSFILEYNPFQKELGHAKSLQDYAASLEYLHANEHSY